MGRWRSRPASAQGSASASATTARTWTLCTLREALLRARDATADVLEAYTLAEAARVGGDGVAQLAAI